MSAIFFFSISSHQLRHLLFSPKFIMSTNNRLSWNMSVFSINRTNSSQSNIPQPHRQMERYWFMKHIKQSPYFDVHPGKTLDSKSELICEKIAQLSNDVSIKAKIDLLISECIWNFLPINRIFFSCLPYLPKEVFRQFPEPGREMAKEHLVPMYENMMSQIRKYIAGRKVFLSFTLDEFKVQVDDFGKRLEGNEIYYLDYLFVIVGVFDRTGSKVQQKYLLKAKQVLASPTDDLSDEFFREEFFNCLKLLWPQGDYMAQAQLYLAYIITEPELEMNQMIRDIQQATQLKEFVHVQYCDNLLYRIEQDIRRKYPIVVDVIEFIRCQWSESLGFRDAYSSYSPVHCPPESFYDSAEFYRDHLEDVQRGLLKSRSPKLKNVREALSDCEFRQNVNEFALYYSELLRAVSRANGSDPHEFSCTIGLLLDDVKRANRIHHTQSMQQSYKQFIENKLGGTDYVNQHADKGDYLLLMALTEKLTLPTKHRMISSSAATKYSYLRFISEGHFVTSMLPKERWVPFRGTKQLNRCFPAFRSLFYQHQAPITWNYFDICAVIYCFIESNNKSRP